MVKGLRAVLLVLGFILLFSFQNCEFTPDSNGGAYSGMQFTEIRETFPIFEGALGFFCRADQGPDLAKIKTSKIEIFITKQPSDQEYTFKMILTDIHPTTGKMTFRSLSKPYLIDDIEQLDDGSTEYINNEFYTLSVNADETSATFEALVLGQSLLGDTDYDCFDISTYAPGSSIDP